MYIKSFAVIESLDKYYATRKLYLIDGLIYKKKRQTFSLFQTFSKLDQFLSLILPTILLLAGLTELLSSY